MENSVTSVLRAEQLDKCIPVSLCNCCRLYLSIWALRRDRRLTLQVNSVPSAAPSRSVLWKHVVCCYAVHASLLWVKKWRKNHCDVIMCAIASQITNLTIVYSTVYSGANQRKHQSSASVASVRENYRWLMNSPHKWLVTRKCFHWMTSLWNFVLTGH